MKHSKHIHSWLWFTVSILIILIICIAITNYLRLPTELAAWANKIDQDCDEFLCIVQETERAFQDDVVFAALQIQPGWVIPSSAFSEVEIVVSQIAYKYDGTKIVEDKTYVHSLPKSVRITEHEQPTNIPFVIVTPQNTEYGKYVYTFDIEFANGAKSSEVLQLFVVKT